MGRLDRHQAIYKIFILGINFLVLVSLWGTALCLCSCKSKRKKNAEDNLPLTPPSVVILKNPQVAVSFNRTPTITVGAVRAGSTVRLFTDHECLEENLVAAGIVEAGKTSIDLTTATLSADPANYQFYANQSNDQETSACSTVYATYQIVACPDEWYVPVEGNAELGTEAFCVMKTEAKKVSQKAAVNYASSPWTNLSPEDAKIACKNLSEGNKSCDIISNPQWMTIAWDIEATAANWSGGEVGAGKLNQGNSDGEAWKPLLIGDELDPWTYTGNDSSDWSQKRTYVLSSGEIIWDFGGNAAEFADWTTGGDTLSVGPNTCPSGPAITGWKDIFNYTCEDLAPHDYLPANPAHRSLDEYTASLAGIGKINGTEDGVREAGDGGVACRGGYSTTNDLSGIFALDLRPSLTTTSVYYGFRCVCTVYP